MKSTRRKSIPHLENMKPLVFVNWMKTICSINSGILDDIKCVMKIDGLGARFGKDGSGRIFFEGSRTGPIFESGSFSKYARDASYCSETIARAEHYDDMLEIFKNSDFMNVVPNNMKIVCEILYNPMGRETENEITFVTVPYDKKKLGLKMTICPYTILDSEGNEYIHKNEILRDLYENSSEEIKFVNPNLNFHSLNIQDFVDRVSDIQGFINRVFVGKDSVETILSSRKTADKPRKQILIACIDSIKNDLCKYILNNNIDGLYNLGPEIEGIVLWIDGKEYKVITNKFKQAIAAKRGEYGNISG